METTTQTPTSRLAGKLRNLASNEVQEVALSQIKPSPDNDLLYRPFDRSDAENRKLALDIQANGVKSPLILSRDFYIISGHRRYQASQWAGLQSVPCLLENVTRGDGRHGGDDYLRLLSSHNLQRVKTISEQMRESIVARDKDVVVADLFQKRDEKRRELECAGFIPIEGKTKRSKITGEKADMVAAILKAVEERREFWPLSVRSIHYALLNEPLLRNCGKCEKRRVLYANNQLCYDDLTNLTARMRLEGKLDWNAISDVTRPVDIAQADNSPGTFIDREVEWFLTQYRRNLLQSQPHHIEIVGEKNTVRSALKTVAEEYGIPLTTARGFSSLDPRRDMMKRYRDSGKDWLIVLALTDFDPAGERIAHQFAGSLRDDFGVQNVKLVKVALTSEHVARFNLPKNMLAKEGDSKSKKFRAKHGDFVWELEALPLEILQSELRTAIDNVLDIPAFNREVELQADNAVEIDRLRRFVMATVQQSNLI